ncbi:hypothetical protein ACFUTU_19950 [Arthrobacter sp. NPDC057388]|uniref:hypothetical protein n=1 Tax=Arthrobacter sp. NPDC057388 TaxID=3346116 RepID=UPI00364496E9
MATNHFQLDHEPWTPFLAVDNGLDDLHGLLCISGNNNSVIGNHFSQIIDSQIIRPTGAAPVIVRLTAGSGNFVSSNHVVAKDVHSKTSDSCFEPQVDALLATGARQPRGQDRRGEAESAGNKILDSGTDALIIADRAVNAFRATPMLGSRLFPCHAGLSDRPGDAMVAGIVVPALVKPDGHAVRGVSLRLICVVRITCICFREAVPRSLASPYFSALVRACPTKDTIYD